MFRLRSSIAVLAVLAAGAVLPAQTATPGAQEQTPVFRGGVEVLPLDVTVLDRDGRQVVDLTGDDFTVAPVRSSTPGNRRHARYAVGLVKS